MRTFRLVRVLRQAVDVDVPDDVMAQGQEAIDAYVKEQGAKPFDNSDWDMYISATNRKETITQEYVYYKDPYEDQRKNYE